MIVKNIAGLLLLLCFARAEAVTPDEAMKAAEQGDASAEYALGTMYFHGTAACPGM